ncbi:hypothetical protein [Pelagicoccus mobilis]|uniref:Uncharacterized protein n=1 Tax=Pelagicoccus mobilis TaxID=415221 RepID=A0A934VLP2_9BACT|nr:hypothetical protein [Pelagicoccus mobilis]MBK1877971.1 hypothetical protein [Pelagicoccus mobilis]
MLFAYPIAATEENWIHVTLVSLLTDVHTKLNSGNEPTKWPDCLPEAHRDSLKLKRSLRSSLKTYIEEVAKLDNPDRDRIQNCLQQQNEIESLLAGTSNCETIEDLPESIQGPIKELFDCGFKFVKELGIRDRHYCRIYDDLADKDCPFCGIEPFDAPVGSSPKIRPKLKKVAEDLDHYLPKSKYPFAATNLRNLVPSGKKCNGIKHDQDTLHDEGGNRSQVFDPYQSEPISISLIESEPFEDAESQTPDWRISFEPQSPKCETWDRLFNICERWIENDLQPHYMKWLKEFALWCRKRIPEEEITRDSLLTKLEQYYTDERDSNRAGRERFRALVIAMILHHCNTGNERLIEFITNAIRYSLPPNRIPIRE